MGFYGLLGLLLLVILLNREEVLPSRKSRGLRIRTSFLAGGREGEPARKLVLILKPLLFLLGKTSSLLLNLLLLKLRYLLLLTLLLGVLYSPGLVQLTICVGAD